MSLQLSPWVQLCFVEGPIRGVRFALVNRRGNSTHRYGAMTGALVGCATDYRLALG